MSSARHVSSSEGFPKAGSPWSSRLRTRLTRRSRAQSLGAPGSASYRPGRLLVGTSSGDQAGPSEAPQSKCLQKGRTFVASCLWSDVVWLVFEECAYVILLLTNAVRRGDEPESCLDMPGDGRTDLGGRESGIPKGALRGREGRENLPRTSQDTGSSSVSKPRVEKLNFSFRFSTQLFPNSAQIGRAHV